MSRQPAIAVTRSDIDSGRVMVGPHNIKRAKDAARAANGPVRIAFRADGSAVVFWAEGDKIKQKTWRAVRYRADC